MKSNTHILETESLERRLSRLDLKNKYFKEKKLKFAKKYNKI